MASTTPPVRLSVVSSSGDLAERPAWTASGWVALTLGGAGLAAGVILIGRTIPALSGRGSARHAILVLGIALVVLGLASFRGLIPVSPGEAVVLALGGNYRGTIRRPGLRWVHPGSGRRRVSTRIRNHETGLLKVNDAEGNPIEISAATVWRVGDPARALLAVDDYAEFIRVQAEAAVRHVASGYAYDSRGGDAPSLRGDAADIDRELADEIAGRVTVAGLTVIEARLIRLAYAPEIAQAMLRVQQANAVVAARHRIVEGAVGMVELALDRLSRDAIIDLDEERRATMVSNLLVVLCSDHDPQPVVNAGTLY